MRKSERVQFEGGNGFRLTGIIEQPQGEQLATAVFAHCFTCSKDLKAIVRISRRLAELGIEVLRFDFTGLGESSGDFSDTNFSSNVRDVLAAISFMRQRGNPATLLIGHSLGGAAMFAAASEIDEAQLIATLASPADTHHLGELLTRMNRDIISAGEGQVTIGGQKLLIRRQMIEDLQNFDLPNRIRKWQRPHLIFHSPVDQTLGLKHALKLLETSGELASLVSLPAADHLFTSDPRDPIFIADTIASWTRRYVI